MSEILQTVPVQFQMPESIHTDLKITSAKHKITMKELISDCFLHGYNSMYKGKGNVHTLDDTNNEHVINSEKLSLQQQELES